MPPLLHTPDQITERPLVALRVMLVPTAKLAEPVVPTGTFSPAGVERTLSPARPVAVRVSSAVAGAGAPTPQTFATPPPPQVCGAVQTPHVSVPPQPSGIVPQFFPWAAQVVGVQGAGLLASTLLLAVRVGEHARARRVANDGDLAEGIERERELVDRRGVVELDLALVADRDGDRPALQIPVGVGHEHAVGTIRHLAHLVADIPLAIEVHAHAAGPGGPADRATVHQRNGVVDRLAASAERSTT